MDTGNINWQTVTDDDMIKIAARIAYESCRSDIESFSPRTYNADSKKYFYNYSQEIAMDKEDRQYVLFAINYLRQTGHIEHHPNKLHLVHIRNWDNPTKPVAWISAAPSGKTPRRQNNE